MGTIPYRMSSKVGGLVAAGIRSRTFLLVRHQMCRLGWAEGVVSSLKTLRTGCLTTSRTLARRGSERLAAGGRDRSRMCQQPALVITAVTVEKRPVSEVACSYGVARPGSIRC